MKRLLILAIALLVAAGGCHKDKKPLDKNDQFRLLVKKNGKYGYCARNGDLAIPAQYENASIFSEGLAAVRIKGKDGFIDPTGKVVIEPRFGATSIFLEGRAAVM